MKQCETIYQSIVPYETFSFPYFHIQDCFTNNVGTYVFSVVIRWNNFSIRERLRIWAVAGTRVRKKEWHRHESTNAKRMTSVWDQETVCTKYDEWQSGNTDPFIVRSSVRPRGLSRDYFCRFAGTMSDF